MMHFNDIMAYPGRVTIAILLQYTNLNLNFSNQFKLKLLGLSLNRKECGHVGGPFLNICAFIKVQLSSATFEPCKLNWTEIKLFIYLSNAD